tara:strand:- start:142 stop:840 length:699 start_codon:yes stop_codon:yes gene_type:complete
MSGFKAWAGDQVAQWGLNEQNRSERLIEVLSGKGELPAEGELETLRDEHPRDPGLLKLIAMRAMQGEDKRAAKQAVLRYADSRPVDPWPHRALVELAVGQDRLDDAIGSLEYLDQTEPSSGKWAMQLAKAYRQSEQYTEALSAAERALDREPYNATYREMAATLALQTQDTDRALHHLIATALIEPERVVHQVRLAAMYQKLDRPDEADAAARKALEVDANAPVQRFLREPG